MKSSGFKGLKDREKNKSMRIIELMAAQPDCIGVPTDQRSQYRRCTIKRLRHRFAQSTSTDSFLLFHSVRLNRQEPAHRHYHRHAHRHVSDHRRLLRFSLDCIRVEFCFFVFPCNKNKQTNEGCFTCWPTWRTSSSFRPASYSNRTRWRWYVLVTHCRCSLTRSNELGSKLFSSHVRFVFFFG